MTHFEVKIEYIFLLIWVGESHLLRLSGNSSLNPLVGLLKAMDCLVSNIENNSRDWIHVTTNIGPLLYQDNQAFPEVYKIEDENSRLLCAVLCHLPAKVDMSMESFKLFLDVSMLSYAIFKQAKVECSQGDLNFFKLLCCCFNRFDKSLINVYFHTWIKWAKHLSALANKFPAPSYVMGLKYP